MKKLQMLLERLLEEVEREDEEIFEPQPFRQPSGEAGAPRALTVPSARISSLGRFLAAEIKVLIESLPDGVLIGTRDGVSICNPSALRILGISSMASIREPGEQIRTFNLRWPDGRTMTVPELPFMRALNGETVVDEYLLTRPNTGGEAYLRTAAAPILDDREISGAVAIHMDLSELRLQVEQLRLARDQADRLAGERSQELSQANASLAKALAEVGQLKDRLEAEKAYLHLENNSQYNFDEVIGQSEALRDVFFRTVEVPPLRQHRGQAGAAALLGLHPSTLRGRMRKHGIQPYEWVLP